MTSSRVKRKLSASENDDADIADYERIVAARRIADTPADTSTDEPSGVDEYTMAPRRNRSHRIFGADLAARSEVNVTVKRLHRLTATSCALSSDSARGVSGSKDGSVVLFDVASANKIRTFRDNKQRQIVRAVAFNRNADVIAVGLADGTIRIIDVRAPTPIGAIPRAHRGAVTALTFGQTDATRSALFSAAADRTLHIFDAAALTAPIETLYGHTAPITDLSALSDATNTRPITCAEDATVRLWKVAEQTQLLYRYAASSAHSVESVSAIDEAHFVTGARDGAVALWSAQRKRPLHRITSAHNGAAVTAVASVEYSDIILSGAADGQLILNAFTLADDGVRVRQVRSIPVAGYINRIAVSRDCRVAIAAVGTEPGAGRWSKLPHISNGVAIVSLLT